MADPFIFPGTGEDPDLSSGSEGYETPDESEDTITKDHSAKSVSLSKPAQSSSDTVSSDSEGSDSPGGGGEPVTLSSKPSLRELRQLPVTNWYRLGLQLKVRQQELERIQLKYGRDLKLCRTKMFGVWRREGDNPSYETLLRGLVAIGRRDVAESICEKKGFTTGILSLSSETQAPPEYNLSPSGTPAHESQDPKHSHWAQPTHMMTDYIGVSDVPLLMTILGEYSYKWKGIGTALGFTVPQLHTIESKPALFTTAPESYMLELLNQWVHWPNGVHTMPTPTIAALEAALQSQLVGLGATSENLRSQLLQKQSSQGYLPHQPVSLPECVEKYAEFLKSKYVEATPLMPEGEWPPNRGRRYSDLTMVEKNRDSLPDQDSIEERSKATARGQVKLISESEKVIKSLDDVLDQDSSKPLKVLMEGVPGVGKSTLVRKSCKDWADGKALKQFHLVILLTLKEQEIRGAKSVEDLLEVDDPELKHDVKGYLQKSYGKDVLFILDGFDELKEEERSIFLKLFRGKLLHKCSIVLTSRSSAIEDFKHEEWIHRHIEILGFTEQQIENYFIQNITDDSKAKAFASSLREEMSSTSVSYTPLNCSILLYIFQQGKCKLPSTLTELFEAFVYSLMIRHSKKINISFDEVIHRGLSSLPKPLNGQFSALCKLAYNGLVKGKFMFSLQDIREASEGSLARDTEANLLSLLVSTTSFSSHGKESHYQFLHVTIQEYLAARWIKDQPQDEQKKFLSNNWISPRMKTMLVFYAGITQLKGPLFEDFFKRMCSNSFLDSVLCCCRTLPATIYHQLPKDPLPPWGDSGSHSRSEAHPLATRDPLPPWGDEVYCTRSEAYPLAAREPLPPWGNDNSCTRSEAYPLAAREPLPPWGDDNSCTRSEAYPLAAREPLPPWGDNIYQPSGSSCAVHTCKVRRSVRLVPRNSKSSPVPLGTQALLNAISMLAEANNMTIYHQIFERRKIRRIQVGHCRLTTVDCSALAKFLSKCPYPLESLCFNFCNLTHQSLEIIHKVSSSVHCHLKQCNKVELNYCSPSIAKALSFLSQIPWFQYTKVLCLHGLQYPEGVHPEKIDLHSVLSLKNLTDLTLSAVNIPEHHLAEYETVFSKFVEALSSNMTLERLTYSQTPPATCKSFVQIMSALSHTSVSLTLGHTKVISADSLAIPDRICPRALASVMTVAGTRGIDRLQVHQENIYLPSCCCQNSKIDPISSQSANTTYPAKTHEILDMESPSLTHAAFILNSLCQTKAIRRLRIFGVELEVTYDPCCLTIHGTRTIHGASTTNGASSAIVSILDALVQVPSVGDLVMYDVQLWKTHTQSEDESLGCAVERMLTVNQTLRSLKLWNCKLDDTITTHIANGLVKNRSLKVLNLGHNNITSTGAVDIFKSLENNTSLEELDLSFNDLQLQKTHTQSEDESLGCAVERMLTANQTLRSLDLWSCGLDDTTATRIANGLVKNHSLKVLNLTSNNVTRTGAVHIFKSLENNTSLEELDLSNNDLWLQKTDTQSEDESLGCAVERMLTANQTLRSLKLWRCRLDYEVKARIEAAGSNSSCTVHVSYSPFNT